VGILIHGSPVRDPFPGIAKTEPLRHVLAGVWSRRLTQEHRIVHLVREDRVDSSMACLSVDGSGSAVSSARLSSSSAFFFAVGCVPNAALSDNDGRFRASSSAVSTTSRAMRF
jgi:hypothetical protein